VPGICCRCPAAAHTTVMGRLLHFAAVVNIFLLFPHLFSVVGDWISTILPYMMWL